ncbi:MAG: T9SS type A sorting domain-containing protein [Bacteroidia bacterium]
MKLICTVLCTCLGLSAFSQITLTSANAPSAGVTRAYVKIDSTGITPGASGASGTWDYSGSVIDTNHISTSFVASGITAYASSFPGCTVAVASGSGFVYYGVSSSSYNLLGSKTPTGGVLYSDNEQLLTFPFTYTNSFSDNFRGHTVGAGLPDSIIGSNSVTADAWGTLKVPGGTTYTNALRVKETETYVDSVLGIVGFHYTYTTYYWYVSTQSAPVFYLQYFSTYPSNNPSAVNKNKTAWLTYTPSAGIEEHVSSIQAHLFPNPATNGETFLELELKKEGRTSISVTDIQGKEVVAIDKGILPAGKHGVELVKGTLVRGMYLVIILSGNERYFQKLIIN